MKDIIMPRLTALLAVAAITFAAPALAVEPSVTITSPTDGAKLDAMTQAKLIYEVVPGPKGDHTHLYIDGKEVAIVRELKGARTLETMAPGGHEICIKVVNKAHTPIGVQQCIKVTVE